MNFSIILFLTALLVFVESRKPPSYIKPCTLGNEFHDCALKNAKEAYPHFLKGDMKNHIPNLMPLHLDSVDINASKDFKISLTNLDVSGLDTVDLQDFAVDKEKRTILAKVHFKQLKMVCTYKMDGKLSFLELQGTGPAELKFDDVSVTYSFSFDFKTKKDGKQYIDLKSIKPKVDYKITKIHFNFQNLFNGNKALGDETNKLLNENGDLLNKELGSSISEVIVAIISNIIDQFLLVTPFDELFLSA